MKMKYLTPPKCGFGRVWGRESMCMVQHNIVSIAKQDAWISLALSGTAGIYSSHIIYLMLAYPQKDALRS